MIALEKRIRASIWHLAEVLEFDVGVLEVAKAALEVNVTKEAIRHPPRDRRDLDLLTA